MLVEGSGRVPKWKHSAYEWFGLKGRPVETAILAELLLRGAQTEGELRQRASRMDDIPDLTALQTSLAYLNELGLVHYLSPPGQKRGVVVCHGVYQADELERIRNATTRQLQDQASEAMSPSGRSGGTSGAHEELAALKLEFAALQAQFAQLAADVEALKNALGS